ncbi:MAG: SDR family NAD(P)-dependent oxidoreductase [Bacteroidota bacterium]
MNNFKDKVALITGAATGIGLQIALQLAEQGARLVINDLCIKNGQAAQKQIQSAGGSCLLVLGDAAQQNVMEQMVKVAVGTYGQLDFCIPNAAKTHFSSFWDLDYEALESLLRLNLTGAFMLSQLAAKQMRKQVKGGKILLMSSNVGSQAYPHLSAYSMSKAALQMMARSLVLELSPYGITINALAPGATITPRTLQDDPAYEVNWQALIPLQKVAQATEIAAAALFLLSDAANHITGQTLVVDGGWTQQAQYPPITHPTTSNQ